MDGRFRPALEIPESAVLRVVIGDLHLGPLAPHCSQPKGQLAMNTAMPYNERDEYRFRDTNFSKIC